MSGFHQNTTKSTKEERKLSAKRVLQGGFHHVKGEANHLGLVYPSGCPVYDNMEHLGYNNPYDLVTKGDKHIKPCAIDLKNVPQRLTDSTFRIELASSQQAFKPKEKLLNEKKSYYIVETFWQGKSLSINLTNVIRCMDLWKKHCDEIDKERAENKKINLQYGALIQRGEKVRLNMHAIVMQTHYTKRVNAFKAMIKHWEQKFKIKCIISCDTDEVTHDMWGG